MTEEQTTVAEAPTRPTLEDLQALRQAKQQELDQLRDAREALWLKRKAGTLDDMGYLSFMRAEDRMVLLQQELAELDPLVAFTQKREAATAAQAGHDGRIPQAVRLTEQAFQLTASLAATLAALRDVFGAMTDPFGTFTDQRNRQVFHLPDGHTAVKEVLAALFPQDFRAANMVDMLLLTPPTETDGAAAIKDCPRFKLQRRATRCSASPR